MLEKLGHVAHLAENGVRAIESVALGGYDLVFMDVQMPLMSGLEATAEIRRTERTTGAHQAIVGLTAYALKGDMERCLDAGMDAYLSKPLQVPQLVELLDRMFPPLALAAPGATKIVPIEVAEVHGGGALPRDVFDLEQATENASGEAELLRDITRIYMTDAPLRLAELKTAARDGDAKAAERAGHRLRGALRTLAASRAARAAEAVEACGEAGDTGALPAAIETLAAELARLEPALDELLRGDARAA